MSALFSRVEVSEYARKIGKSERTLWRWIKEGCNPRDPKSLREFDVRAQIRETPIERARKRRRDQESHNISFSNGPQPSCDLPGNGELPPAGRKGAAHALERLEARRKRRTGDRLQRCPVAIQSRFKLARISG